MLASLERGLGCREPLNPEPALAALPPERIAAHRHVVFWLIDGFALDYLAHAPALRADLGLELESLFPSTTATAITSVLTGLSPAQHGLLGWRTYLPAGNATLTVLPGRETDAAGRSVELSRQRLGERIRPRLLADRLERATTFVSPAAIAYSAYNRLMSGTARVLAYERLEQLPALIGAHVRATARAPHYTYLYWSLLDHLGHEHGPASAEVRAHLGEIDTVYRALREALAGTDTLLLTSTDHGMRPVSRRLDLRTAGPARACLRHPLTGEPRAALAHVRSGRHRQFRRALQDHFGPRVEVVSMQDWIDADAFGPGAQHPELIARAGDYLLLPDDDSYLVDPTGDDPGPVFHGAHGGRSPAERRIPLCLWTSGVA
ncbi:Alkaline phosphodiesterase I / Nucleotide pyrophosphatase [Thioalkalivibrio nitratireducens DSM 14787]|uniref:Alkaline phosphodiesterase I / Nucleotide pyrophosphatase n=1 Tax=Thioalkalivibrio nitratireducens (strain DSM 14787 / UNIQEM 213 / ALEN2) TaxID=1255043 RepID=L0E381_THIND|nr:alkaline phosphatase family protein [Thioalkalivibrio nitratireducens]AGA35096.1 Alkaline phosphodiesterase I / Nucleotide pyrophosphatase [Thioalkalivibrio nitratireducens DSM 14787]